MAQAHEGILLVEDNPDDVLFARRAFKKAKIQNELVLCHFGDDAWRYLRQQQAGTLAPDKPRVGIAFLDIHVPRMSGLEVLETMRGDPGFADFPAIMLSGSDDPVGMERARVLGAEAYLIKPPSAEELLRVLRASGWSGLRLG